MADKPSRGLVLYGDGLAHLISPSHTNLHSLAAQGVCGLLSLPHSPHADLLEFVTQKRRMREWLESWLNYWIQMMLISAMMGSMLLNVSKHPCCQLYQRGSWDYELLFWQPMQT
ncbi:hypothetical protein NE237_000018 [Protea cynaroides]|uniref:Uncharacterized protein n=1 Tax=Protea cynaroides TaxID=273540 RepID=A0A9Q0GL43_9MAGN|nr:hypothetical protein NE237_000018 [Protea cynaroides]